MTFEEWFKEQEVVDNYPINLLEPHMFFAYCAGISKAEKHHGITQ